METLRGNSDALAALTGKYLAFALSGERYALEILKVQEIIGVTNITRVPRCPNYIKGVINLRGKIIPLIDLRVKFGLPAIPYNERTCIIVVNIQKEDVNLSIGVIVDTVLEVINFARSEIEQAPNYGNQIDALFIIGMGRKSASELNILIDVEKALSINDLDQLKKFTE